MIPPRFEPGAEARLRREANDASAPAPPGATIALAVILALVCLLFRIQNLMAMPIFGDEAIYLRWAQLIRQGHLWVSLADPKPPFHFWLIAALFNWTADPLSAARALSVAAAVITIPAAMGACVELGLLRRTTRLGIPSSGRAAGALAAIFLIFCPFLAFYQRLATADALFVAEMFLAVWAALAWARLAFANSPHAARRSWLLAILLGLLMGLTMLTRQGLSYTLWAFPIAAACIAALRAAAPRHLLRTLLQFLLAALLAAALWAPYLVAQLPQYVHDAQAEAPPAVTVSSWNIIRQRILYQDQFSQADNHLAIAQRNAAQTFLPTFTDARGRSSPGWLWLYLTPPLYIAGLLGLLWLALRGQWPLLALVLLWLLVMLGPIIFLGNVVYSRYILAGAVILLIPAAWLVADLLSLAFSLPRAAAPIGWTLTPILLAGLLFLPFRDIGRQINSWAHQTLTPRDRYQYLTGWTSGQAAMGAIHALQRVARESHAPIVVITDTAWGLPADAAWVYLSPLPNVHVYFTSRTEEPLLIPDTQPSPAPSSAPASPSAPVHVYWLLPDKWLFLPQRPVYIPPNAGIFYITNDPIHASDGDHRAPDALRKFTPNLPDPWTFYGIDGPVPDRHAGHGPSTAPGGEDQVDVFRLP